jgi:peptidoglycan/xylan/chitin deacetylase (PgdA/CDA1 family)
LVTRDDWYPLRRDAALLPFMRLLMRARAPGGRGSRLSILVYHRVHRRPDPLFPGEVDADRFDRQMQWIGRIFNVLQLDDAVRRLFANALPPSPACITFDDGYADNLEVAVPILLRHGVSATFFISAGFVDGGRMWNDTIIESVRATNEEALDLARLGLGVFPMATLSDRRAAIHALLADQKYRSPAERADRCAAIADIAKVAPPSDLMLRANQILELHRAGMGIGAHTMTHPILASLPLDEARREISGSRDALEAIVGARVGLFAYPNGKPGVDYGTAHVEMVRALGFDAALSTMWGVATAATDRYQLPRFTPWDRSPLAFALRLCRNLFNPVHSGAA